MPIFGHKEQSIHVRIRDQIAPLEELANIDAEVRRHVDERVRGMYLDAFARPRAPPRRRQG